MTEYDNSPTLSQKLLDLVVYVVVLTGLIHAVAFALTVILGTGPVLIVHVTFVFGFLMFGYATYLLWPSRPWETKVTDDGRLKVVNKKSGEAIGSRAETHFQSALQRLPPLSKHSLTPSDRLSPGVKLFTASVTVLASSFVTEVIFVT